MEELLRKLERQRNTHSNLYRDAELMEGGWQSAYADGVLEGMDIMIRLVREFMEGRV